MRSGDCVAAAARMRSRHSVTTSFMGAAMHSLLRCLILGVRAFALQRRRAGPFDHGGQRQQRLLVRERWPSQGDAIALEAERDRAPECVDDAECAAEKIAGAAEARASFTP